MKNLGWVFRCNLSDIWDELQRVLHIDRLHRKTNPIFFIRIPYWNITPMYRSNQYAMCNSMYLSNQYAMCNSMYRSNQYAMCNSKYASNQYAMWNSMYLPNQYAMCNSMCANCRIEPPPTVLRSCREGYQSVRSYHQIQTTGDQRRVAPTHWPPPLSHREDINRH